MPRTRPTSLKLKHRTARPSLAEQISTPPAPRPTIEEQVDCLFNVAGLAKYLGVVESWIYQATAKGSTANLPFIKVGGHFLRFRKSSIDRWLAERERQRETVTKK